MDGICVLRRNWTGRTDWGQFILVVEEKLIFYFQVLHKCRGDVNYFVDFVLNVNAEEEEQVRNPIGNQHDS